jgi:hypothetical protein
MWVGGRTLGRGLRRRRKRRRIRSPSLSNTWRTSKLGRAEPWVWPRLLFQSSLCPTLLPPTVPCARSYIQKGLSRQIRGIWDSPARVLCLMDTHRLWSNRPKTCDVPLRHPWLGDTGVPAILSWPILWTPRIWHLFMSNALILHQRGRHKSGSDNGGYPRFTGKGCQDPESCLALVLASSQAHSHCRGGSEFRLQSRWVLHHLLTGLWQWGGRAVSFPLEQEFSENWFSFINSTCH